MQTLKITGLHRALIRAAAKRAATMAGGSLCRIEPGIRVNNETGETDLNAWRLIESRDGTLDGTDLSDFTDWTAFRSLTLSGDGRGLVDFYVSGRDELLCNVQAEFDTAGLVRVHESGFVLWSRPQTAAQAPQSATEPEPQTAAQAPQSATEPEPRPEPQPVAQAKPQPQPQPIRVVDMTPTWTDVLPLMLEAYANGNATGRKAALTELRRMAQIASQAVADDAAAKLTEPQIAPARTLIHAAERDLNRRLSDGERRDLLKDSTELSNHAVAAVVARLRTDVRPEENIGSL